jgi:hypothetical protein
MPVGSSSILARTICSPVGAMTTQVLTGLLLLVLPVAFNLLVTA